MATDSLRIGRGFDGKEFTPGGGDLRLMGCSSVGSVGSAGSVGSR